MSGHSDSIGIAEACAVLREERHGAVTILTMSAVAYWGQPREDEYRLVGLMGAAGAIGLGVAIGLPQRPVRIIDGDGSLLMQLGVLSAISDAAPPNLTYVVLENGMYSVSGGQPTPGPVDWVGLFHAAGFPDAVRCQSVEQLRSALRGDRPGPRGIAVRCERRRPEYPPGAFAVNPAEEAARLRSTLTHNLSSATAIGSV